MLNLENDESVRQAFHAIQSSVTKKAGAARFSELRSSQWCGSMDTS